MPLGMFSRALAVPTPGTSGAAMQDDYVTTLESAPAFDGFPSALRPKPTFWTHHLQLLPEHINKYAAAETCQIIPKHEAPPLFRSRAVLLYPNLSRPSRAPDSESFPSENKYTPSSASYSRVVEASRTSAMERERESARAETVSMALERFTAARQICATPGRGQRCRSWDRRLRGAVRGREHRLEPDGREAHARGVPS